MNHSSSKHNTYKTGPIVLQLSKSPLESAVEEREAPPVADFDNTAAVNSQLSPQGLWDVYPRADSLK